jgi:copper oxidase (laccase) domain-containing protein
MARTGDRAERIEVGPDVHAAFCDRDAAAGAASSRRVKANGMPISGLARLALGRAGVGAAAISGGRCTYTERASFHSYRRGGPDRTARMATLIWLAPG